MSISVTYITEPISDVLNLVENEPVFKLNGIDLIVFI